MLFLIAVEQDDLVQMKQGVKNSTLYLHSDFLGANIPHELKEVLCWCNYGGEFLASSQI